MHREYIDSLYNKFRRESKYETKSQIMFNIIEIKIKFGLKDYTYSLCIFRSIPVHIPVAYKA